MPLADHSRRYQSVDYEEGVSCPKCVDQHTDEQKARFREREKQVKLARERGEVHVGGDAQHTIAERRQEKLARKEAQRKGE